MEHTPYHTLELRQPRKCYSQCLVHFIHAANPEGQAQTDLKIQFTTDTDVHVLPLATSTDTAAEIITRWKPFQDDLVLTNNLHARTLVLRDKGRIVLEQKYEGTAPAPAEKARLAQTLLDWLLAQETRPLIPQQGHKLFKAPLRRLTA